MNKSMKIATEQARIRNSFVPVELWHLKPEETVKGIAKMREKMAKNHITIDRIFNWNK